MTRVKGFGQLVADVLEREIDVARERASTLLGAAMCAAVGVGAYNSLPEASERMHSERERVKPEETRGKELEEEYERWLGLYEKLDEIAGSM